MMKVFELIEELKKCPQDSIVMYNFENSYDNEVNGVENNYGFDVLAEHREFDMGIDDVLIGSGTLKGFVFLVEDLIEVKGENVGLERPADRSYKKQNVFRNSRSYGRTVGLK